MPNKTNFINRFNRFDFFHITPKTKNKMDDAKRY